MKKYLIVLLATPLVHILFYISSALSQEPEWINYTYGNRVFSIEAEGKYIWVGTSGGLVKIDQMSNSTNFYNKGNSGLPDNNISSIAIDETGNKWIGTFEYGLAHFDGVDWMVYNTFNSNLPDNYIETIATEESGITWIGSYNGFLTRIDENNWIVYDHSNSDLPGHRITSIAIDNSGIKWIGTLGGGLVNFDGDNWTVYNTENSDLPHNEIWSIAIDGSGNKWIGTAWGGLSLFDGTDWTVYNASNSGLPTNRIRSIAIDGSGIKWIGTMNGLVEFDGMKWITYNTNNSDLPHNYITSVTIDGIGNTWIGTIVGREDGALTSFNGTKWVVYNTSNSGLPSNMIESIAIDGRGIKWIGTWEGLVKFDGTDWNNYNTSNSGLPDNSIRPIAIDGRGIKWIGTVADGLVSFDGTNWTVYNTSNSDLPSNRVRSIAIDRDGTKWIGTYLNGIASFDGTDWTVYRGSTSGLPSSWIMSITIDGDGAKWIGTSGGMVKFDGENWTVYNESNSALPSNMVRSIAIDDSGIKWIGTSPRWDGVDYVGGGLVKFDGTNWTVYNTSNSGIPDNFIRSIAIDGRGIKWIGTLDSGLVRFDGTDWKIYNTLNSSLPSNDVYSIVIDSNENKWIGTWYGGLTVYNEGGIIPVEIRDASSIHPLGALDNYLIDTPFWIEVEIGIPEPVSDLYGISFKLQSETDLSMYVDESAEAGDFLGNSLLFFSQKINDYTVDIGATKTEGVGVSGNGIVARAQFTTPIEISGELDLTFSLLDVTGVDSNGNTIPFDPSTLTINKVIVWPGDTNNDGKVDASDLLPIGLYYGQSRGVNNSGIQWQGYIRSPWQADGNTPRRVFADANGDGVINAHDVLAIGFNYGKSYTTSEPALYVGKTLEKINGTLDLSIILSDNSEPEIHIGMNSFSSVHGISFKIKFDGLSDLPESYIIDLSDGVFGEDVLQFSKLVQEGGFIDIGLSQKADEGFSGEGELMRVVLHHEYPEGSDIHISLEDIRAIDDKGNPLTITSESVVSIKDNERIIPAEYTISQNYPNPFNPVTTIEYGLPSESNVVLVIYDMLGREVTRLVDESQTAGMHRVNWDSSERSVSSGIYIYRIAATSIEDGSTFVKSRRMVLMK